jgi:hypothetical protein
LQKKKEEEENKELQVIRSGLRSRELGKKKIGRRAQVIMI